MTTFTPEQLGEIRKIFKDEVDKRVREEWKRLVTDEVTTGIKHFASGDGAMNAPRDQLVRFIIEEVGRRMR